VISDHRKRDRLALPRGNTGADHEKKNSFAEEIPENRKSLSSFTHSRAGFYPCARLAKDPRQTKGRGEERPKKGDRIRKYKRRSHGCQKVALKEDIMARDQAQFAVAKKGEMKESLTEEGGTRSGEEKN